MRDGSEVGLIQIARCPVDLDLPALIAAHIPYRGDGRLRMSPLPVAGPESLRVNIRGAASRIVPGHHHTAGTIRNDDWRLLVPARCTHRDATGCPLLDTGRIDALREHIGDTGHLPVEGHISASTAVSNYCS